VIKQSEPRSRRASKSLAGFTCPANCRQPVHADTRVIVEVIEACYVPENRFMVFHVHCHPRVVARRFEALTKRL
jgi:hypothetical protein